MVSISRTVAVALVRTIATFFRQGAGVPISENYEYDTEWNGSALVDDIHPEDYDLAYWANNILMLLRTLHGILQQAIADEDIIDEFEDT
jgi:hypothetical protein